jgi:Transposase DDE domain
MFSASIHEVATGLQVVFNRIADDAAHDSGFVRRQSKLTGDVFVRTLTFGWLHNPDATLQELAQTATDLGVPISPQGLEQRLGPRAAACLEQVLKAAVTRVLATHPVAIPLLQRFSGGVSLMDSSTLVIPDALADRWPGCGGKTEAGGRAAIKLHVRFNVLNGALQGPFLHAGRTADATCDAPLEPLAPGTLRLADQAYFDLQAFAEMTRRGVWWLSRVKPGTRVYDAQGRSWSLAEFLKQQTDDRIDVQVRLGKQAQVPCRLLARRVPPHVAEQRRERLREKQRWKERKYDSADPWVLTEWTLYATNVPETMLGVDDALVLARCRWQLELLWKLWKSQGRIDESRSQKPWRIMCEIYAKLLGMVVQHWTLLASCWSETARSLVKASATVRRHAPELALNVRHGHLVRSTLERIARCLKHGCRVQKRQKQPSNHQLLSSFTEAA